MTAGIADSGYNSSCADSRGNIYATGYIRGTQPFSFGNNVTATGTYEGQNLNFHWIDGKSIVLVKYDSSGNAQWARTVAAGPSNSEFHSVTVDSSGNIYAAGYIRGDEPFSLGNGVTAKGTFWGNMPNFHYQPGKNVVLVKYDISGTAQWAQTVTVGPWTSEIKSLTGDTDGNIYAAGYIYGIDGGTYNFGNGVTATGPYGGSNILLVKYNSSGTAQWAQTMATGTKDSMFNSVAADSNGNIYAAGCITGKQTYNFGNGVIATGPNDEGPGYWGYNILLVKYNSSGAAQWAQTVAAGSSASWYNSIAQDSDEYLYAVGTARGTTPYNFGNSITVAGVVPINNDPTHITWYPEGFSIVITKYKK